MPTEDIIIRIRTITDQALKNVKQFNHVMGQNLEQFRRNIVPMQKNVSIGARFAQRIRMMTHGMRGFRMEMLGVMFFGMGLQRFFTGLLRPALQITGAMELWATMLQVLFLPVALFLLEYVIIPLMNLMMGLSGSTQMVIGVFVLLGAIVGTIIFLAGMLALGVGSMILAFGSLFGAITAVLGFAVLGGIVLALIAIGVEILAMGGPINFLKNVLKGLYNLWIFIWERIKLVVHNAWQWIYLNVWVPIRPFVQKYIFDPIKSVFDFIVNTVWKPIEGVFRKWVIDPIKTAWDWLVEHIKSTWEWISSLLSKIKSVVGKVGGKILGGGQTGISYVPHTGPYMLHAGETVTPAGSTFNSSPTVNVYASPGMNVDELVRKVSEVITRDLASLARR